MPEPGKRILLLCRQSPYGSQLGRGALDIALAASVCERDISVLFLDDGVWQLQAGQGARLPDSRSVEKTLASFSLYGLEQLYADAASLRERGLGARDLSIAVESLPASRVPAFIAGFAQLVSC